MKSPYRPAKFTMSASVTVLLREVLILSRAKSSKYWLTKGTFPDADLDSQAALSYLENSMRKKVTVVGAGNLGANCALRIAGKELAAVVLVDVLAGVPPVQ